MIEQYPTIKEKKFDYDKNCGHRLVEKERGRIVKFELSNNNNIITIGKRTISISQLKPYDSWELFFPKIKTIFENICKTIEFDFVESISLRYLNKIEIPKKTDERIRIRDYFNIGPRLDGGLKDIFMIDFITGVKFVDYDKAQISNVTLTPLFIGDGSLKNRYNALLDLKIDSVRWNRKSEILSWIDSSHAQIKFLFQNSITQKTLAILEEEPQ